MATSSRSGGATGVVLSKVFGSLEKTNLTKTSVWHINVDHAQLCGGGRINSTFWPVKKALIWADMRELALPLWKMIRLFLFFEFLQRNCGVPLRIDHGTMFKWNSRYMTSVGEETGDHLLRSAFSTNNFGFGLYSKAHMVDCCFVSGSYIDRFMICHLWRSYKRLLKHRHRIFQDFYAPIDKSFFWAIAGFSENKSMLVKEMSKDLALSVQARH